MNKSQRIPELDKDGNSEWFVVRVRTPSSEYWDIARYMKSYKQSPWRDRYNHSLNVILYLPLPKEEEIASLIV